MVFGAIDRDGCVAIKLFGFDVKANQLGDGSFGKRVSFGHVVSLDVCRCHESDLSRIVGELQGQRLPTKEATGSVDVLNSKVNALNVKSFVGNVSRGPKHT